MGLKEKMISEINDEIKKDFKKEPIENIQEETALKANEHLVSSFLGIYSNQFPSEKRAAEAFIQNLSKLIKD